MRQGENRFLYKHWREEMQTFLILLLPDYCLTIVFHCFTFLNKLNCSATLGCLIKQLLIINVYMYRWPLMSHVHVAVNVLLPRKDVQRHIKSESLYFWSGYIPWITSLRQFKRVPTTYVLCKDNMKRTPKVIIIMINYLELWSRFHVDILA